MNPATTHKEKPAADIDSAGIPVAGPTAPLAAMKQQTGNSTFRVPDPIQHTATADKEEYRQELIEAASGDELIDVQSMKSVTISSRQKRILLLLSQMVDAVSGEDRAQLDEYAQARKEALMIEEIGSDRQREALKNAIESGGLAGRYVRVPVALYDFASKVLGRRAGGQDLLDIRNDLEELTRLKTRTIIKGEKETIVKLSPFISAEWIARISNEDGRTSIGANIELKDPFFVGMKYRFIEYPANALNLLNNNIITLPSGRTKKVNSELYEVLFMLMIDALKRCKTNANAAIRGNIAATKKDRKTDEEMQAIIDQCMVFTRREKTLIGKTGDRYKQVKGKKTYIRKARFDKDMEEAVLALKQIKLVKEYRRSTNDTGEIIHTFVLNREFRKLQDEEEKEE